MFTTSGLGWGVALWGGGFFPAGVGLLALVIGPGRCGRLRGPVALVVFVVVFFLFLRRIA